MVFALHPSSRNYFVTNKTTNAPNPTQLDSTHPTQKKVGIRAGSTKRRQIPPSGNNKKRNTLFLNTKYIHTTA